MFSRKVILLTAALWSIAAYAQAPATGGNDAATAAAVAALVGGQQQQQLQPAPAAMPRPVSKPSAEAAEIAAINERVAVMAARLAELDLQAKIATKQAEITKAAQTPIPSGMPQVDETIIPSVSEISGIDNRIWAVLNVQGGTQTVRVGDVAAGWKVTAIKPDSVTVDKKGRTLHLSFGSSTIQTAQPQPTNGGIPNVPYPGR